MSARIAVLLVLSLCLVAGCGRKASRPAPQGGPPQPVAAQPIDLPAPELRAGTAVILLVDTSGSMAQQVPDQAGKPRAKYLIARDALNRIVEQTAQWKKAHPDRVLQMGIYNFSSSARPVLPMGDFDAVKVREAINHIPNPGGGTAIGHALEEGFKALYRTGCIRKFVVCITDGENTSGPPPDRIARQLHAQTKGDVRLDFIAFDVAADRFKFLKEVNGDVVQASDGAQLEKELKQVYEQKILVEKEEP